jgi:hypothetical protein
LKLDDSLMRSRHLLLRILIPAILGLLGSVARADLAAISEVTVGIGDRYKVGYWTPVWVTLTADAKVPLEGKLSLSTRDGDGVQVRYQYAADLTVSVPAGQSRTFLRGVKFGRVQAELGVEVLGGDGNMTRRVFSSGELPTAGLTDTELMLTIGQSIGENDWLAEQASSATVPRHYQVSDAAELPNDWLLYEAVDTMIIATANNDVLEKMTDDQIRAIGLWVQMGGRLVFSLGARGSEVLGDNASPTLRRLADFVPGEFAGAGQLNRVASLEIYGGSSYPLKLTEGEPLRLTMLENVRGVIELSDTGVLGMRPLVVRASHGFGQVIFVAVDLELPPLSNWQGRTYMVGRLLRDGLSGSDQPATSRQGGRMAHVGFTDLAGQLRSALDQFTGVSLVPFYWVAGLVFLYILLIGPGDYFFLRRVVRRMPYTWVTFPLLVMAFSTCAVYLYWQLKDDRLRVNQVDLVDIDLAQSVVRGSMWADIYSPHTRTFDLDWKVDSALESILSDGSRTVSSWQGLPGAGLGGLNTRASLPTFTEPYRVVLGDRDTKLLGTPIQVCSTKAFHARWWGATELKSQGTLYVDSDRLLRGQIENPLPIELTECAVFFGRWLYRLDSKGRVLAPGDSVRIEVEKPLNLEWRLTRRRVEDTRDVSTPWSQSDLDVPRILEMMMFHGAVGGDRYTQLTHRYQAFVDLSQQLARGRAVLVGRGAGQGMHLEIDGQQAADQYDRTWAFYRIVLPVAPN